MIIKNATGRLAFGELEDGTLIPMLQFFIHYEDKTYKEFSIIKGTDIDDEKFIESGKHCVEEFEKTLIGKEYDEKELFSILEKYDIFTKLPN